MKISKYKDLEYSFFEGEDLTPEEELFLKNEIDHPYFSFLEEEKKETLNVSFEEFLLKAEEPKIIALPKKKTMIKQYWMAASLILFFGMAGLWTINTPEIVEPGLVKHKPNATVEQTIEIISTKKTESGNESEPQLASNQVEKTSSNELSHLEKNIVVQTPGKTSAHVIDRNTGSQDYNPNYVIVNGKPIYSEDEAIAVAENAINYFASNVTQTIKEADAARNVSKDLHQIINF